MGESEIAAGGAEEPPQAARVGRGRAGGGAGAAVYGGCPAKPPAAARAWGLCAAVGSAWAGACASAVLRAAGKGGADLFGRAGPRAEPVASGRCLPTGGKRSALAGGWRCAGGFSLCCSMSSPRSPLNPALSGVAYFRALPLPGHRRTAQGMWKGRPLQAAAPFRAERQRAWNSPTRSMEPAASLAGCPRSVGSDFFRSGRAEGGRPDKAQRLAECGGMRPYFPYYPTKNGWLA